MTNINKLYGCSHRTKQNTKFIVFICYLIMEHPKQCRFTKMVFLDYQHHIILKY